MRIATSAVALGLLLLSACGSAPADEAGAASAPPSEALTRSDGSDAQLSGVLGGDPDLEGGCVWLQTDNGRVEVLWPDRYEVSTDPVELRDDSGDVVAADGDRIEIDGAPAPNVLSVCQVGEIWTASAVRRG